MGVIYSYLFMLTKDKQSLIFFFLIQFLAGAELNNMRGTLGVRVIWISSLIPLE